MLLASVITPSGVKQTTAWVFCIAATSPSALIAKPLLARTFFPSFFCAKHCVVHSSSFARPKPLARYTHVRRHDACLANVGSGVRKKKQTLLRLASTSATWLCATVLMQGSTAGEGNERDEAWPFSWGRLLSCITRIALLPFVWPSPRAQLCMESHF
jgi:hypothetical protein